MKSTDLIELSSCPKEWDKMTPCGDGRFCGACNKVVVDFSKKTLEEVNHYVAVAENKEICGHYQAHHIDKPGKWFQFLNAFERCMTRLKMPKFAFAAISVLLLMTGCGRTVCGGYGSSRSSQRDYSKYTVSDTLISENHLQE